MASTEVRGAALHVDRRLVGTAAVVTLSGALSGETVRLVSEAVLDSGNGGIDLLAIDVEHLEVVDRDGLLGLAYLIARVRRAGTHAVLASPPPGLQDQMEAAGLADDLPVARERGHGLAGAATPE